MPFARTDDGRKLALPAMFAVSFAGPGFVLESPRVRADVSFATRSYPASGSWTGRPLSSLQARARSASTSSARPRSHWWAPYCPREPQEDAVVAERFLA